MESGKGEKFSGGIIPLVIVAVFAIVAGVVMVGSVLLRDSSSESENLTPEPSTSVPSSQGDQTGGLLAENFDIVTSAVCREIFVTFEDLAFRSRDFSQQWGPETVVTGKFVSFDAAEGKAIFLTQDGSEIIFYGGEGSVFTSDCPLY